MRGRCMKMLLEIFLGLCTGSGWYVGNLYVSFWQLATPGREESSLLFDNQICDHYVIKVPTKIKKRK
jgi:hypothetical protein